MELRVLLPTDCSTKVTSEDVDLGNGEYESGCLVFRFMMPDHDVDVEVHSRSNMMYDPSVHPDMAMMGMGGSMGMLNGQPEMFGNPVPPVTSGSGEVLGFCPNCGWKNEDGQNFCAECGTMLRK